MQVKNRIHKMHYKINSSEAIGQDFLAHCSYYDINVWRVDEHV